MMGPHWNPKAAEISIVTRGSGMVQMICPTSPQGQSSRDINCQNTLFRVQEGDVFVVPKYHPMAQMSFNNDSFVFMGFSTNVGMNHPQFLAGKRSVLQALDKEILAMSFGTTNSTIVDLLASQSDAIILGCISCAEDLERKMEEEEAGRGRREEEEERRHRREEEEERRREEEEERRRREEEEEARKREEEGEHPGGRGEEERRRRREEEGRRGEEARRREEGQRREEEAARRREEEARRREEAARRREEEPEGREERRRRREEEEEPGSRGQRRGRRWEEEEEEGGQGRGERQPRWREEEEEWGEEEEEGYGGAKMVKKEAAGGRKALSKKV